MLAKIDCTQHTVFFTWSAIEFSAKLHQYKNSDVLLWARLGKATFNIDNNGRQKSFTHNCNLFPKIKNKLQRKLV